MRYEGYSDFDSFIFENQETPPKAVSSGIMQYVLSRQPKDFCIDCRLNSWNFNKGQVITLDGKEVKLELHDHHIMPLATARTINDSATTLRRSDRNEILNSPLNRTYILAMSNQYLGSKSVSEYVSLLQDLASFHHCIPSENFAEKNENESNEAYYKRFLLQRYKLLKDTVLAELDNLYS